MDALLNKRQEGRYKGKRKLNETRVSHIEWLNAWQLPITTVIKVSQTNFRIKPIFV